MHFPLLHKLYHPRFVGYNMKVQLHRQVGTSQH